MERRPTGTGGAEFYNPAGADGAGEKGGAAVVALGGHSIRLSCCCNKSLLFAKSVVCVCVRARAFPRAHSPAGGGGCSGWGLQVARGRGGRGRGRSQVELPCGGARTAAMRCCRLYEFGNFRPRARAPASAGDLPHGPWFGGAPRGALRFLSQLRPAPPPRALQTRPAVPGGLCAWASC